ncbi:papain family cysteine protease [Oesophagostomum dentatum]|uniref:Papain family cysteine protease n=1 Tax=Oesophagostomum dentatum TaxID=61180 RepID=A0A0B1SY48_OESDE|nr:papain family cysteine protease [Oesophagostomum dentatum]
MKKILKTVSVASKCSQWVAMLDATYFASELSLPVEKRTITRDYCPVSCNYCSPAASTSSSTKTSSSTTPKTSPRTEPPTSPPTTPEPEQMLKDILKHDSEFRRLASGIVKFRLDLMSDAQDSLVRYQMFEKSREKVEAHNELYESGKSSYKMAVNQFSIAKPDEFAPLALSLPPPMPLSVVIPTLKRRKREAENDTVDFREYMYPVTNQVAAEYLQMKGLTSGEKYPFRGEAMEERVRKGPVAVGMAVSSSIYSYSEGIFDGTCGSSVNHAVVIVGFTAQYWIIRNSWGSSWGENGYIRILRRAGDPCKLTVYWAQPAVVGTYPAGSIAGNAVVEPQVYSTTTEIEKEGCCDGECCDFCDCDDDDDEDYYSSEWISTQSFETTKKPSMSSWGYYYLR